MLRNTITIAKNTLKEALRDRILLAALFLSLFIIMFSVFIGSISLDQNIRMIIDFSLSAIYILQVFVAIFVGSMLMYKEIERRTFFLIIPKPISMNAIILGKCLGLTIATTLVSAFSTIVLIIMLLIKGQGLLFAYPIILSVLLSLVESTVLILITMLFSSFTSPILSAVYTIGIFLIGHSGEFIRYLIAYTESTTKQYILQGAYYLLPNLEKFNIRNEVVYNTLPSGTSILLSALYGFAVMTLLFLLTKMCLEKKEY
jgi:ABC-type transport system involved in multi-copper enzyme maturation permease subunit